MRKWSRDGLRGFTRCEELFTRYNVGGTPITIFTDSTGHVLDYAVGGMDKAEFMDMLGNLKR
jgi:thioredoxin 1